MIPNNNDQVNRIRLIAAHATLDLLTNELVSRIASYDRINIVRATANGMDAIEVEVWVGASMIDAMIALIGLLDGNAPDGDINDAGGELAACLDTYDVCCQNTNAVNTELTEEMPKARDRRRNFHRENVTQILPGVQIPDRRVAPMVDVRTLEANVSACLEENLDFTRVEAADFLREEAVGQEITGSVAVMLAAVDLSSARRTYGASSAVVDRAVTALADRREDYHVASDASDRADMALIEEIRRDGRIRRTAVVHRTTQLHTSRNEAPAEGLPLVGGDYDAVEIQSWPTDVLHVTNNVFCCSQPYPVSKRFSSYHDDCGCDMDRCVSDNGTRATRSCINVNQYIVCDDSICFLGPDCGNRMVQRFALHLIQTRVGLGVVCDVTTPKGAFIIEYVGEVLLGPDAQERADRRYQVGMKAKASWEGPADVFINAFRCGNESRCINHSCTPNCDLFELEWTNTSRLGIYAKADIPPLRELTFRYSDATLSLFTCQCGQPNCINKRK